MNFIIECWSGRIRWPMVCQHFPRAMYYRESFFYSRALLADSWPLDMDTDVKFMFDNERYHTMCVPHQLTKYHTSTTWWTTIRKTLSASKWLEPILDPEFIIWDRSEFSQECHVSEFSSFSKIRKYSNLTRGNPIFARGILCFENIFDQYYGSALDELCDPKIRICGQFLPR